MASKNTKAMPVPFTKPPLLAKGRLPFIEKASPESKNTFARRGELCEELALEYYEKRRGYRLWKRRWDSGFAEIDLVLKDRNGYLLLVEVKSVTSFDFLHLRLQKKQKARLKRALLSCAEKWPGTRMELAVVSQQGEVQTFSDIFD